MEEVKHSLPREKQSLKNIKSHIEAGYRDFRRKQSHNCFERNSTKARSLAG
jgi:hypothetical protein